MHIPRHARHAECCCKLLNLIPFMKWTNLAIRMLSSACGCVQTECFSLKWTAQALWRGECGVEAFEFVRQAGIVGSTCCQDTVCL
jgi:hypothetical protein